MLSLVSFLEIQVVVRKEMVVILGPHHLVVVLLLHVLVGVEKGCLVLPQLVVVVLVVEVL